MALPQFGDQTQLPTRTRSVTRQGVTATAIDATTVQFDLAVPLGGFLQAATQPLLPAHLLAGVSVADLGDAPFSTRPIGDGPFALTDLTAQAAELVPVLGPLNAGSGPLATLGAGTVEPGQPLLAGLELRFYPGPDEAIAAYQEVLRVSEVPPKLREICQSVESSGFIEPVQYRY